jgi:hypothetical protein
MTVASDILSKDDAMHSGTIEPALPIGYNKLLLKLKCLTYISFLSYLDQIHIGAVKPLNQLYIKTKLIISEKMVTPQSGYYH